MISIKNFYINDLIGIMLIILPIALISGPFIPDLLVVLISIFFLIEIYLNKRLKYLFNFYSLIFLLIYIYLIFNSLISNNPLLSLESTLFYFRFFLLSLALWMVLDLGFLKKIHFYYSVLVPFIILFFDGFFQYFTGFNFFGFELSEQQRVSSFFKDELIMGGYLLRLLPILIIFFIMLTKKNFKNKIYFVVIFFCVFLLILISGERSAIFASLVLLFFTLFLLKEYRAFMIISLFILSIIILIMMESNEELKKRIILKTLKESNISNFIKGSGNPNIFIFTEHHEEIYKNSINLFMLKPLLGIGPKMFREDCQNFSEYTTESGCSSHSHNYYIQILTETGSIGFALFISFLFYIIWSFYLNFKRSKSNTNQINFNDLICINLVYLFIILYLPTPSGNFFNNWLSIFHFIPLGIFFYLTNNKNIYEK